MRCSTLLFLASHRLVNLKRTALGARQRCVAFALVGSLVGGCGGNTPEPETAEQPSPPMQEHQDEEFGVTQEVGALPIEGANYAFDRASKGIQRCFFGGTKKFELLGGSVDFHVTVDQQANVVAAYAERSTLGHHETEECMLKAVRSAPWPAAVGGLVATAQRSFEFTPSDDMRPPVEWDASMVQALVNENKQSVETCKSGAHGTFAATIYVATDGSPMSVGVAPPQAAMDKQRSCLLALIRELEFPSPGSWPAKVSIQL